MSNYVLSISLEGADKADAALDSLLKKVGSLSAGGKKMSFEDFISHDPMDGEQVGQKIGESVSKGVSKKLMSFNVFDAWGKSLSKFERDMGKVWDDALKVGAKGTSKPGGALGAFIDQRHAESGKTVDKDFWTSMFPAIKGDKSIQQLIDQRHAESGKMVDKDFWSENFPPLNQSQDSHIGAYKHFLKNNSGKPPILSAPEKLDLKKIFTGLFLGVSNPYIGSRVLSDELGKKLNAKEGGIAGGLFGKGGIAGFSEIFIAFKAFKIGVDIFKAAAKKFFEVSETAARFYSNALQNGMGLNFSIKRSKLAEIMGVSEQDVFRFGAQMAYLNPKLEQATAILAKTAMPLTQVNWHFKILETDFQSLFAVIADKASPALLKLIDDIDELTKAAVKFSQSKTGTAWDAAGDAAKAVNGSWLQLIFKYGLKAQAAYGSKGETIPSPQSWMKQLPASSWEKMGLVIGGGSQNYAKETAKNTREMAKGIAIIAKHYIGRNGANLGNFGMSPNVAQP